MLQREVVNQPGREVIRRADRGGSRADSRRDDRLRDVARRVAGRKGSLILFAVTSPVVLLALGGLPDWAGSAWSYILLALGFSLVIFVHELGHFLTAKWAGVRVERFAIGFGKELFGFTKGETRYSFNALPLGGYVKMLGQEDFVVDKSGELKVKDDPTSFTNKSVGQRMVIISAGVIMNLLFAAVAFGIVVMIGRPLPPPVVGQVIENSPAARAGLQTGDRIAAVNGSPVESFGDLSAKITLSDPGETLILDVIRGHKPVNPPPQLLPEFKKDVKVRQIGVGPGMNRRVWLSPLRSSGEPRVDELHENDELYQLVTSDGPKEITDLGEFHRAVVAAEGNPIEVIVKRPKSPEGMSRDDWLKADLQVASTEVSVKVGALWTVVPFDVGDVTGGSLLGLVPRLTIIYAEKDKSFDKAGVEAGDVIAKIGPNDYPSFATVRKVIEENAGREIPVEVRRPLAANGTLTAPTVAFCSAHREVLIAAARDGTARAMALTAELAGKAGLAADDNVTLMAELTKLADAASWRRWLEAVDVRAVGPLVPKAPFVLFGRAQPPPIDAGMTCIDEDHLVVADVIGKLGDRITPSKAAGIPVGAVILACDGREVRRWSDLCRLFRAAAGKEVELTYRVADQVHRTQMAIPECITAKLDLPIASRIVRIDGKTSFPVRTPDGELHEIALPDWRAVKAALDQAVGRTVAVEYVTFEGDRHSGQYAVNADNTDPWLQRVLYLDSFTCYPLLERHRVANPLAAVGVGFRQAYQATMQTVQSIRHMLITRQVGLSKVSGPVGIVRIGSQFADSGALNLLWFLAVISANLAVINFLPMPIVDGGLFLFLILEKIRGEPVSIKTQVATQLVGIALIAAVFILVTYQDIKNWITGA